MVNVSSETPQHLSVYMGVQCINGYICTCEYLTIIPRARVGYEMIDQPTRRVAPSWL